MLTADQFVGRDVGVLEQQKQDSHVCQRNGTFPLILRKNQSPHYKGDEFLTCDTIIYIYTFLIFFGLFCFVDSFLFFSRYISICHC